MPAPRPDAASPPAPLRILGLDPGSRFTGYGLVDRRGARLACVAHGRIALAKAAPLASRLADLSLELTTLIRAHGPDVVVLESLYHGVNPRSLIVLAQARGALITTVALAGLPIHEYSPAEVKTALTGHGRADKQQVSRMVSLVLGLKDERLSPDAGDALAVAICYAQRLRLDRLGGRGHYAR